MNRSGSFGILGLNLLVIGLLTTPASASELEDYIAHVREYRMTALAEITLDTVASYQLGHSVVTFQKDQASGRYWPGLRSMSCPNPEANAEELAQWQAELNGERKKRVFAIRAIADSDESGFVTTPEAERLRSAIEFGLLARHIQTEGDLTLENLAAGAGVTVDDAEDRLAAYQEVCRDFEAAGIQTPLIGSGLPTIDL